MFFGLLKGGIDLLLMLVVGGLRQSQQLQQALGILLFGTGLFHLLLKRPIYISMHAKTISVDKICL
jgi:hypothetical protein